MAQENQLSEGISSFGMDIEDGVQDQMIQYINLLAKWNRTYNLTAVRDPKQMITRHLLDSMSILPYVKGDYVLDIGSGAGLPGIPLALCLPDLDFTLLDSNGKKTRFMTQVVKELRLDNVSVVKSRVEEYIPDIKFDTIMSRAFSSIGNLMKEATHLSQDSGIILAMKGTYPLAEMDEIENSEELVDIVRLDVPGVDAERHIGIVKSAGLLTATEKPL